jgi:predicted amidophosphoribosyltransferase
MHAAKYVPLRYRVASPEEIIARRIARDLKIPTAAAIQIAAPQMAALIDGPCWLVPVPASNGSLSANLALARAIAELVLAARVKCAIGRAHPVESSASRRMRGLFGLTVEQHAIIRTAGPIELMPVYFVDNVITTGTTIAACRRAFGWGIGLAYADASRCPYVPRFGTGFDRCPVLAR